MYFDTWAQLVGDSKTIWPMENWQSGWNKLKRNGEAFLGSLSMSVDERLISVQLHFLLLDVDSL